MAGDLPPVGRPEGALSRVAARLTTPIAYLAVLGGMRLVLLWTLRDHVGARVAATSMGAQAARSGRLAA
jgi:hypothetical protein